MFEAIKEIYNAYGLGAVLILLGLVFLSWIARVSLKNPLTVYSNVLNDVETARKALNEELVKVQAELTQARAELATAYKQLHDEIQANTRYQVEISKLEARVAELERHLKILEASKKLV